MSPELNELFESISGVSTINYGYSYVEILLMRWGIDPKDIRIK